MAKKPEGGFEGGMSPEERHMWDMKHTQGYKELIEGGLSPKEANWFIALATVENHAPFNLSEGEKAELAAMRERLKKNRAERAKSDE